MIKSLNMYCRHTVYIHRVYLFNRSVISSGGVGVLVNLDKVAQQLESLGHRGVQVRGLSDSGWVVERQKYKFGDCVDVLNCGPISSVKRGVRWDTRVPTNTTGCLRIQML